MIPPLQREAIVAGLTEQVGQERAERLAAAADGYFTDEHPGDTNAYMNALLREAHREDFGSTKRWDRNARRNGILAIGREILPR